MAKEQVKAVEEEVKAPVKEAPVSPTIPLEGAKSTTLPNGTVRTDY